MKDNPIRNILNGLIQDCQNMDENLRVINLSVDNALNQIAEIVEDFYIDGANSTESKIAGYNDAISDIVTLIRGQE